MAFKENEEESVTKWDAYHLLLSIKRSSDLQILINNLLMGQFIKH